MSAPKSRARRQANACPPKPANILSLVACAKDRTDRPLPDGNDSIATTRKQLEDVSPKDNVVSVASLTDIVQALSARKEQWFDVIQIVGHATPGMLSLAYTWDKAYADKDGVYVLDSNPYAHGVLAHSIDPFMRDGRSPRVILVGCQVGSNDETPYLARGSSLIFDLHKMWRCPVLAAVDIIGPSDFVNGRFAGRVQGYAPNKNGDAEQWRKSNELCRAPEPMRRDPSAAPIQLTNVKLVGAPVMGLLDRPARISPEDVATTERSIQEYSECVIVRQHPLAMPELTLTAMLNGSVANLEVLANGTLLRVTSGSKVMYLRRPGGVKASPTAAPERTTRDGLRRAVFARPPGELA